MPYREARRRGYPQPPSRLRANERAIRHTGRGARRRYPAPLPVRPRRSRAPSRGRRRRHPRYNNSSGSNTAGLRARLRGQATVPRSRGSPRPNAEASSSPREFCDGPSTTLAYPICPRPSFKPGAGMAAPEGRPIVRRDARPRTVRLFPHYLGRLQTLGALRQFELDLFSLLQRAEAGSIDGCVMDEDFLSIVHRDKTVALFGAEPLDYTDSHYPREPPEKTKADSSHRAARATYRPREPAGAT